jgi:hypothetical protein
VKVRLKRATWWHTHVHAMTHLHGRRQAKVPAVGQETSCCSTGLGGGMGQGEGRKEGGSSGGDKSAMYLGRGVMGEGEGVSMVNQRCEC